MSTARHYISCCRLMPMRCLCPAPPLRPYWCSCLSCAVVEGALRDILMPMHKTCSMPLGFLELVVRQSIAP